MPRYFSAFAAAAFVFIAICIVDALWLFKIAYPATVPLPSPSPMPASASLVDQYQYARAHNDYQIRQWDRERASDTAIAVVFLGGAVISIVLAFGVAFRIPSRGR
jgi:hypothetical protein